MSLTDCLSERRIWKDPRFLLCINCSILLIAGLYTSIKEKMRELSYLVWGLAGETQRKWGKKINLLQIIEHLILCLWYTVTRSYELTCYIHTVCGQHLGRCFVLAAPNTSPCLKSLHVFPSPLPLFIPGCKIILLRCVGQRGASRVSATCSQQAPLLHLKFQPGDRRSNPSTFNTPPDAVGAQGSHRLKVGFKVSLI